MSSGYNGWRSYETWLIGVEVGAEIFKEQMQDIWQAECEKHETSEDHLLACVLSFRDALKESVHEIAEWGLAAGGDHTIARSLVYGALREVDWRELSEAWFDDFLDEFEEKWPALAIEETRGV